MLDSTIRPLIDPPLHRVATLIARYPVAANHITIAGFIIGLIACVCVYCNFYAAALLLLGCNRLCDGLDGPLARHRKTASDFGGYLDIVLDFVFYGSFPFAVAAGIGTKEALMAGGFILLSFIASGTSFLAYAILCGKRGLETSHQGQKSFYFSNGLMEGTETVIYLVLICIIPSSFVILSVIFACLCLLTAMQRIFMARAMFQ